MSQRLPTNLILALAAVLVGGCATTTGGGGTNAPVQTAAAPAPSWSKDYFKIGARLFPRCETRTLTGSRVTKETFCYTDAQIAQIESGFDINRAEMRQRISVEGERRPGG